MFLHVCNNTDLRFLCALQGTLFLLRSTQPRCTLENFLIAWVSKLFSVEDVTSLRQIARNRFERGVGASRPATLIGLTKHMYVRPYTLTDG